MVPSPPFGSSTPPDGTPPGRPGHPGSPPATERPDAPLPPSTPPSRPPFGDPLDDPLGDPAFTGRSSLDAQPPPSGASGRDDPGLGASRGADQAPPAGGPGSLGQPRSFGGPDPLGPPGRPGESTPSAGRPGELGSFGTPGGLGETASTPAPGPMLGTAPAPTLSGRLPRGLGRARWRPSRRRPASPEAPPEGKWVTHRLRHVSPRSVFKVAGLFYACVFLTLMVASVVLWNVGRTTETIDNFEGFISRLGAYGPCEPEDSLDPGTDFERDDDCPDGSVRVGGFKFDGGTLFRVALFGGIVVVIGGTGATVLMTVLFNLLAEVTGGVRYTTLRESSGSPPRSPDLKLRR